MDDTGVRHFPSGVFNQCRNFAQSTAAKAALRAKLQDDLKGVAASGVTGAFENTRLKQLAQSEAKRNQELHAHLTRQRQAAFLEAKRIADEAAKRERVAFEKMSNALSGEYAPYNWPYLPTPMMVAKKQQPFSAGNGLCSFFCRTPCALLCCATCLMENTKHKRNYLRGFIGATESKNCTTFCTNCVCCCGVCVLMDLRASLRRTFRVGGNSCSDCLLSCFCPCCVAAQTAREYEIQMLRSGFPLLAPVNWFEHTRTAWTYKEPTCAFAAMQGITAYAFDGSAQHVGDAKLRPLLKAMRFSRHTLPSFLAITTSLRPGTLRPFMAAAAGQGATPDHVFPTKQLKAFWDLDGYYDETGSSSSSSAGASAAVASSDAKSDAKSI
jgi:Cys-rich protein (TIGR01571 family)